MKLGDLDDYLQETLRIREFDRADTALNGLQVGRKGSEIRRVACAVDACMETFRRSVEAGADLLFVHHGLFWGADMPLRRSHLQRIRYLLDNDLALYAVHLPLDAHPIHGNNARIASRLGMLETAPFGNYHGVQIGCSGRLPDPLSIDEVLVALKFDVEACAALLPLGVERSSTVGIVSGGATREVEQAVEARLDLYVTGDTSHMMYHCCLEESINLLCAGHYQTETFGVTAIAELLQSTTDLETTFIDVPTGL
jgi:dinuclear metal center YbgI/SA1388 family protein